MARGLKTNARWLVAGLIVLLATIASAQSTTYLFHRHYWHGISEASGMDKPDAMISDVELTAIWGWLK